MEGIEPEVKRRLRNGEDKIAIYNLLQTPENGQDLAYILNKTPTAESKKQTKGMYLLLLTIVLIIVTTQVFFGSALFSDSLFDLVFLIPAILTGVLGYFVYSYEYAAYRTLIVWEIINGTRKGITMQNQFDLLEIAAGLAVACLCYYLSMELFPHYTPKRKLVADENGHYPVYE
jgi:hypothetical protein